MAADIIQGSLRPISTGTPGRDASASSVPSTLIELDGTISSSPDGTELVYKWRQVSGPKVELSDYSSPKPYFRTSQPGAYEFELVVSADGLDSEPYLVNLIIEQENLPPVAKIPPEIAGQVGKLLEIDAQESFDPEGANLSYRWRILTPGLDIPVAALSLPVLAFEPRQDGVFEMVLTVSDGEKYSIPMVTRLTIKPRPRPPVARVQINTLEVPAAPVQELVAMSPPAMAVPRPTARIEGPVVAILGDMVMLDGRTSHSYSGRPVEYLWRQKSGPFVNDFELVFDGGAQRFKASRPGDYEFELVVSDDDVESEPYSHKVRIVKDMDPPVAVVVAPTRAMPGDLVKMDATQSYDMGGSQLVYRWRQTGGPQVRNYVIDEKLGDSAPAFHPPSAGIYSFELIVSNGKQQSKPIEIDIEVGAARRAPVIAVTGPEVANAGERLVLEAGAPGFEDRRLSYTWQQVDGPAMALVQTNGAQAGIAPPMAGRYIFDVSAMENGQAVASLRRTLEVFNAPGGGAWQQQQPAATPVVPVLVTPPTPVPAPAAANNVQTRRRVPELTPLPNTTAPAPIDPALPSTAGRGSGSGRAAAQVMQGGKTYTAPPVP